MYIWLALIAIFIVMLPFNNKKAKKFGKFILDHAGWLALLATFVGVTLDVSGYEYSWLYDELINFVAAIILMSPGLIGYSIWKKKNKKKNQEIQDTRNLANTEIEEEPGLDIPKTPKGRSTVVRKFSENYQLNLQEEEIKRIVDGSFQSEDWAMEIFAMKKKYNTESEWYSGQTAWLRAYLKAFNVQNVSSDFEYQKNMCVANFDEIFSKTDFSAYNNVWECIKDINERFLTNFDDLSFMIAYRFLESNGKKYSLPSSGVAMVDAELDSLKQKYAERPM